MDEDLLCCYGAAAPPRSRANNRTRSILGPVPVRVPTAYGPCTVRKWPKFCFLKTRFDAFWAPFWRRLHVEPAPKARFGAFAARLSAAIPEAGVCQTLVSGRSGAHSYARGGSPPSFVLLLCIPTLPRYLRSRAVFLPSHDLPSSLFCGGGIWCQLSVPPTGGLKIVAFFCW